MKRMKAVVSLGLAALVSIHGVAARAATLNVLNWSDYIGKTTVASYEKATGVKVRYDALDSDDTLQAKLLSGHTGYDVVHPTLTYMAKQIGAGVYEPLDWSKIPNRSNLDPELMKKIAQLDPGNRYGVPYAWGTEGISVNLKQVGAILGKDAKLDALGWNLLFNPDIVSKLSRCGVSMVDSPSDVFPIVLAYMGRDPNSKKVADYRDAYNVLKRVRPYITQFSSTYINDVAGGDVCIAYSWSGDAGMIKRRVQEARRDFQVAYLVPKGGGALWFTMMAIPKDAKNKEDAYKWLNFILKPDVSAGITNDTTYATANAAARSLIAPALLADTSIYPNSEQVKHYFVLEPIDPEIRRTINALWLQFKANR
ncbi:extracellular solute-binding protein [Burkholderia pseudomultivorans]|uniref:Putrescine-binding periplasmic protein n=1 Tax=Burkholderia pseudomultivorans TaxID=1207504 RepID=A0ABU2E3L6_9BURK|nr:extracellular solute-binding protein [Burkholderia pseudomultivorans]MDR8729636.1 Putrescine-binding periplasmic protein [Burkholderia pseudomultivorans]MDR8737027.1 Putrescine-binding periplasmic protein [Burkholderia pseudomultivorans]MDR8743078.1 Putrescine-binding periplasmic protein [Burkholderia pseudomultivorans]MDR8754453.1 Putrescine-binding periplasmic protein [Burkholderia pseudomultivorans]MDR8779806.1 Putrescine-binding periplasmic protein [Burkholderia pseudomultivorans]